MEAVARSKWVDYSKAKDEMFEFSDLPETPWQVVDADDKYCARLNTITHLLKSVPFKDLTPEPIEMPPRQKAGSYERPPIDSQKWIPCVYPDENEPFPSAPPAAKSKKKGKDKSKGKKKRD